MKPINTAVSRSLRTGILNLVKTGSFLIRVWFVVLLLAGGMVSQSQAMSPAADGNNKIFIPFVMRSSTTPAVPAVPVLSNGDFENGTTGWTEYSANGWPIIVTKNYLPSEVQPRSGSYAAWLGGDAFETSYLERSISVSANAPYLTFYYRISSTDTTGNDTASIRVNNSAVKNYTLSAANKTSAWVKGSINLSAYAGKTVLLQFRAEVDGNEQHGSLFIDDVGFSSSP